MTTVHRAAAILFTIATAACAGAPSKIPVKGGPVDTGAGSLTAARKYLEGEWTLVSYRIFPPGQTAIQLTGIGTLTYDAFGNLDMQIRVDGDTAEILGRVGVPTDQGVLIAKGRTVVDMQSRTLTYVLDGQPKIVGPAGPLALSRPRHWEVSGDVLTLRTKGDDGQVLSEGRWKKVS